MRVIIEPYNTNWPDCFLAEREAINKALQQMNVTIEHIGSTAIEGLAAKPVIDILVGVRSNEDLDKTIVPMIAAGYTYVKKHEPLWPTRRFFVRLKSTGIPLPMIDIQDTVVIGEDVISTAHIHIIVKDSHDWIRHLALRDFLRQHAVRREAYGQLKQQLSLQEFTDTLEYNKAKDAFVKQVEEQALAWFDKRINNNESGF
jgi:GrpB-like predicted nucleotidyltransferase (UPF0157 family)